MTKKSKQNSRRYKRYIRKKIKKALNERLFKKFKIVKSDLPDVTVHKCHLNHNSIDNICPYLAMPKNFFDNTKCKLCQLKPNFWE